MKDVEYCIDRDINTLVFKREGRDPVSGMFAWSYLENGWVPFADAYGYFEGFEDGRIVTEKEAMEFIEEGTKNIKK